MTAYLRIFGCLAVLAGLGLAGPARAEAVLKDGVLIVHDDGNVFSPDGIKKAKDEFTKLHTRTGRQVTVQTLAKLPDAEKAKYDKIAKDDKAAHRKFWSDFTRAQAKDEHAKGVFILINRKPGHVHVLADQEMTRKGFDTRKAEALEESFVKALRESSDEKLKEKPADQVAIRDKALFSAVEYLEKNLPGTEADLKTPTGKNKQTSAHVEDHRGAPAKQEDGGMGLRGWLCLGISAVLGIWLITALVRAFSGGGGGGGYGGGGGGGGGFFPSLLGGLFGAAAGMWMYDHFFGGHSSSAMAGDAGAGGSDGGGGNAVDDAGAGDWSGGAEAGGDYDAGGGDWGGGGGDVGGGGGDFGGGDF
jgi:hypothetical protein